MNKEFMAKINKIQRELKSPKAKINEYSVSKFSYRNCEAVLSALKPLLGDLIVTLDDEIINQGDRFYIKATATISDGETQLKCSSFAREALQKKGMDDAQITGSASSYARKYALCGLFLIDDEKEIDTSNNEYSDPIPSAPPVKRSFTKDEKGRYTNTRSPLKPIATAKFDEASDWLAEDRNYEKIDGLINQLKLSNKLSAQQEDSLRKIANVLADQKVAKIVSISNPQ